MKKKDIIFLIVMFSLSIFALIFVFAFGVRAYTIKDTVYVPDSITVTMSWEEWERVRVLFAQDSLWKHVDWERTPVLDPSEFKYFDTAFLRKFNLIEAWFKPDSGASLKGATINTLHSDTTNPKWLFKIYSDTNYTVDPATAIILNELMDCMEDYSYTTVMWYEEF